MATKLTDRERKYRAEAIKAKAELKALKERTSERGELNSALLNIGRELHRISHEQREQYETLKRYEKQLDRIEDYAGKNRDLFKEVNAHMWQTQNRMGAVRDFMVKHIERPSLWTRLLKRLRRKP